jgi:hypothetical protein
MHPAVPSRRELAPSLYRGEGQIEVVSDEYGRVIDRVITANHPRKRFNRYVIKQLASAGDAPVTGE